jgi:acyl carrier protein
MTTSADILTNLLALIREQHHLDVSGVTLDSGLADVGLDSLAVAELLFSIEETFKVSLDDVAPEELPATVGELVALIQSHQK